MSADKRISKQIIETTISIAEKVGCRIVLTNIVNDLKDDSTAYRKMVIEAIDKIVGAFGVVDIHNKIEEVMIDGILKIYQDHVDEETGSLLLNIFATVLNSMGKRSKPYLPQICGTIKWRLNNKNPEIRKQAADLIARIVFVLYSCDESQFLRHLGQVLFDFLDEEYPDVLGSIIGAIRFILNVLGVQVMNPCISDLVQRLVPIIKNRNERVQENSIELLGAIAENGAEMVSSRELMRICFDLLDMLKASKKSIRRATVNAFGYIASAIGPQDVVVVLLNNLKVQERQDRVCTTIALAIVAESCYPFTVIPALLNEYKMPDIHVQNGVLKTISFMFEYIGEMGKDYINSIVPLLEDALIDRDLVHRQTASFALQHIALSVAGMGCEEALLHLFNYVWPNIFETSPHIIQALTGAFEGIRVALGPCVILSYLLQGLYHPSKKVREVYWRYYNILYVGSQDVMVAFYPSFEDIGLNTYERKEIDLFI